MDGCKIIYDGLGAKAITKSHFVLCCLRLVGGDSSVGMATRYGLDGPGIESRCGRYFPHPSTRVLGPTQPSLQWLQSSSWE